MIQLSAVRLSFRLFGSELREFPQKLSSSGWDIARTKTHPTTGFSGTNDSRYVLPLSVEQQDLTLLRGTNALVIRLLLRPENAYQGLRGSDGENAATLLLEEAVHLQPEVRVIIDVGMDQSGGRIQLAQPLDPPKHVSSSMTATNYQF